jgi:hypothetical protein
MSPVPESGLWPPTPGPNGGVADTLDEANAAFRAAGSGNDCYRREARARCARLKPFSMNQT